MAEQKRIERTLASFGDLAPAEEHVVAKLREGTGHFITLPPDLEDPEEVTVPDTTAGPDRQIRATFLRWLALGAPGEAKLTLHEKGLRIAGALILGDTPHDPFLGEESTKGLDLEGCHLPGDLGLFDCRFLHPPVFQNARLPNLFLDGSTLPGLTADRLRLEGNLQLSTIESNGEIRLVDAWLGGNLNCEGAELLSKCGKALNAAGATVEGAFFWRSDKDDRRAKAAGVLDLTAAEIGSINDSPDCWPAQGCLILDRCRYAALMGKGVVVEQRIRWLGLQDANSAGADFWSQPWEHCARVLREMGHPQDARQVFVEKERRQRADRRQILSMRLEAARILSRSARSSETAQRACSVHIETRLRVLESDKRLRDQKVLSEALRSSCTGSVLWRLINVLECWARLQRTRIADFMLGGTIRYGQQPLRAVRFLFALWIVGVGAYSWARVDDAMKPNNPFILRSAEWVRCAVPAGEVVRVAAPRADGGERYLSGLKVEGETRAACFMDTAEGKGYPGFDAMVYSADVLFPLVQIEQQANWVPDEDRSAGLAAKLLVYAQIVLGWALSLLAVAGFSGLVKSD